MGMFNKAIKIVIKSTKIKGKKECLNIFELALFIFKVLTLVILFFYIDST